MTSSKWLSRNLLLACAIAACLSLFSWGVWRINYVRIPTEETGAILYANHAGDDLRSTFFKAIENAERSVTLIIYSLTDPRIINALNERAKNGISVSIIYDKKASSNLYHKLDKHVHAVPVKGRGLMHQKLLVVDDKLVWIGSANMTSQSLRMHDNLVIGIYSPLIAEAILQKADSFMRVGIKQEVASRKTSIGNQQIEILFLPDDHDAVLKIKELIREAKKTIRVAMFTWTRLDFAKEIVKAAKRGVQVEIKMDSNSGNGVSSKVVDYLKSHDIAVHLSQGSHLLHHKLMIIDNETLATGSANWTKAAFTENDDCIIILNHLSLEQLSKLDAMWKATQ